MFFIIVPTFSLLGSNPWLLCVSKAEQFSELLELPVFKSPVMSSVQTICLYDNSLGLSLGVS